MFVSQVLRPRLTWVKNRSKQSFHGQLSTYSFVLVEVLTRHRHILTAVFHFKRDRKLKLKAEYVVFRVQKQANVQETQRTPAGFADVNLQNDTFLIAARFPRQM